MMCILQRDQYRDTKDRKTGMTSSRRRDTIATIQSSVLFDGRALQLPYLIPPSSVSPEVRCERIISSDRPRWHWFDWTLTSALVLAAECRYTGPHPIICFPSPTDTCWCMERATVSDRSTMSWDKEISSLQGFCLSSRRSRSIRHSLKREKGDLADPFELYVVFLSCVKIWNNLFASGGMRKFSKTFCFPFQNV